MNTGTVYLVGSGPGDAGLVTVRAMELIRTADVLVYDRLVGEEILELMPDGAKKIDVGKNAGNHPVAQEEINAILVREAKEHECIVRLKGGDPFVFGRGGEEAQALLENNIPFEIVPGVTSAVAAPAYAGIPVTHREFSSSLHIITGHGKGDGEVYIDYQALKKLGGTLVFMMSVSTAPEIAAGLIDAGFDPKTPAAIIENGTTPRQRSFIGTLSCIEEMILTNCIKSPAVIVVGGVCAGAQRLEWLNRRPLNGCRVLITRPREMALGFGESLRKMGAGVTFYPCIKTRPISFDINLQDCDWAIFTSAAGVNAFFTRLWDEKLDARALGNVKIAAVGAKTAGALKQYGVIADFVPDVFDGENLAAQMLKSGKICVGQNAVLYRAKIGTEELLAIFRSVGINVTDIPVYETDFIKNPPVDPEEYNFVTFTSASCVKSFVRSNEKIDFCRVHAVCIGNRTAKEARLSGMKVTVSERADTESMLKKIAEVHGC